MIRHTGQHIWACPQCRHSRQHNETAAAMIVSCHRCQFVFPAPPPDGPRPLAPGDPASADAAAREGLSDVPPTDETWTRRWGPIRAERYRVIRTLASGAQGQILLAHHRFLDQPCVIKLVDVNDEAWAEVANKRIRLEAQAGIRVNHPNVARVYDCDCVGKAWYFVMEYIAGENLRKILQQVRRLTWRQVVDVGAQIAAGLSAIHAIGVVHRDVKPGNVMLTHDGVAKIMDLGLAKVSEGLDAMGVTWAGQAVGTPLYMPPEQFAGSDKIDDRADVYALGATLYHLLTGRPPFEGSDIEHLARLHRTAPVTWTDENLNELPRWLRETIESCLAKRREHRPESAEAVEEALRANVEPVRRPVSRECVPLPGVVVTPFQNLSRQPGDAWIGDAIAECLSSRLMAFEGVHVADRDVFNTIVEQQRQSAKSEESDGERTNMLQAARLVGVSHVFMGSFHRQGDEVRIIAHVMEREHGETRFLGSVQGPAAGLFALEDELTDKIVEAMGPVLNRARRRRLAGGGTESLEAHEKYIRGKQSFVEGDYQTAINLAREAQAIDPEYAEPLSLMGSAYARLGEYERAVECHERQERLAREHDDRWELAVALGNLGAMYYYKGEYAIAYEFLERATAMRDEESPAADTAKLFGNLGMVLMRLDRTAEAEAAFERAIGHCKQLNDLASMVWPYNGMGSVLLKQDRVAEAREFHQRALALAEEIGDRVMVGVSQMNLGRCAALAADFTEAERWFRESLATLDRTRFWNGLTLVYEHLAEMYLRQNRADDALATVEQRIGLARRHGNRRMEAQAWEQQARAFELIGRTDDALKALKKSVEISQQPAPYESLHRYLEEVTSRSAFR